MWRVPEHSNRSGLKNRTLERMGSREIITSWRDPTWILLEFCPSIFDSSDLPRTQDASSHVEQAKAFYLSSGSPSDPHSRAICPALNFISLNYGKRYWKGVPSNFTRQGGARSPFISCLSNLFLRPTPKERSTSVPEGTWQGSLDTSQVNMVKLSSPWTMNRTRQIRKEQERL